MSDFENGQAPRIASGRTIVAGLRLTPELFQGIWFTLILAVVGAAGKTVVAIGIQQALDGAADPEGNAIQALPVLLVCLGGVVLAAGATIWMNRRLIRASERALAHLRVIAFDRILRIPPHRLGDAPRSALVSRVTSDIDTISQFTQTGGVGLVTNALQTVIATVVMLSYSWPLALTVVVVSVPIVVAMRGVQGILARRYTAVRIAVGRLYGVVGESLDGAEVIRGFGAEERIQSRVDGAIAEVERRQLVTNLPQWVNGSYGELVGAVTTVATLLVGVWIGTTALGIIPSPTFGELVAFFYLITFFTRPLQFLISQFGEAQNSVAGWQRVLELIELAGVDQRSTGVRIPDGDVAVDAVGISYEYVPGRPAVQDIDLSITAGTHVVIVGETGSGKSTFAKLLTRELVPTTGSLQLNSVPIETIDDDAFARRVAVVPQDAFLFDRSVAANIALVDDPIDRVRVEQVVADLALTDWVSALPDGLDTEIGLRGALLSAGGRQLVALARAAYLSPDLLILDEATSGIDPETDVRVQHALDRLTAGRTTVTIAHRMATARAADQILVFDGGRIVEQGTHAELIATGGRYAALVAAGRTERPRSEPHLSDHP